MYAEEMKKFGMIHGEYNYHNIIMTKEGIATTNFEKFHQGYSGGRSVLFSQKSNGEKWMEDPAGRWHAECVFGNPSTYQGEMEYLKIRLIYPEKFWKIANSYYFK